MLKEVNWVMSPGMQWSQKITSTPRKTEVTLLYKYDFDAYFSLIQYFCLRPAHRI